MMRTLATFSMLLLASAPAVLATHEANVGVNGECFDGDGSGGRDQAIVNVDDNVITITLPTVTGALAAVQNLADSDGDPTNGTGCTSAGPDRLEAHVYVDSVVVLNVGACYQGVVSSSILASCYTHP